MAVPFRRTSKTKKRMRRTHLKKDVGALSVCPQCGAEYQGHPAISRKDNKTPICPDCGTREALESIGIDIKEQEKIIRTIHRTQEK